MAATIRGALTDLSIRAPTQRLGTSRTFHWDRVLPEACDWLERQEKPVANQDEGTAQVGKAE